MTATVTTLPVATSTARPRGSSNANARGSSTARRRRREWLVETYGADVKVVTPHGVTAACRCYRCGTLLTVFTVTADRIVPGCMGGTYRRDNIRPACAGCNSETGGALGALRRAAKGRRR